MSELIYQYRILIIHGAWMTAGVNYQLINRTRPTGGSPDHDADRPVQDARVTRTLASGLTADNSGRPQSRCASCENDLAFRRAIA
jgi:hypothetical protein